MLSVKSSRNVIVSLSLEVNPFLIKFLSRIFPLENFSLLLQFLMFLDISSSGLKKTLNTLYNSPRVDSFPESREDYPRSPYLVL